MTSLAKYALGAAVLIFIAMGIGLYYQHSKISSQALTIASQATTIDNLVKDKKAQDKADKQLQADKDKAAKERDMWKNKLNEALKGNGCTDVPFDDNTQLLLNQLYGKQGS